MKHLTLNGIRQICPKCLMSIRNRDDIGVVPIGKPPAAVCHYQCFALFTAKVSLDPIATGQTVIHP